MLHIKKLNLDEIREIYNAYMHEAFPPSELRPFASMEMLYNKNCYPCYAFTTKPIHSAPTPIFRARKTANTPCSIISPSKKPARHGHRQQDFSPAAHRNERP